MLPSVCLCFVSIYPSVCASILCVCMFPVSTCMSVCCVYSPDICLSVSVFVCIFVSVSVCLFVSDCVCQWFWGPIIVSEIFRGVYEMCFMFYPVLDKCLYQIKGCYVGENDRYMSDISWAGKLFRLRRVDRCTVSNVTCQDLLNSLDQI